MNVNQTITKALKMANVKGHNINQAAGKNFAKFLFMIMAEDAVAQANALKYGAQASHNYAKTGK